METVLLLLTLFLCVPSNMLRAQLNYTGGVVQQSFDSLSVASAFTFALGFKGPQALDAAPLSAVGAAGWSIYSRVGTTLRFAVNDGASGAGGAYSYGASGSGDRALGSLGTSSAEVDLGLRLVNQTGQTLNSFIVTYQGEQWRTGASGVANKLNFSFKIGAGNVDLTHNSGFTTVSALSFTAPRSNSLPTRWNGNLPSCSRELSSEVTGIAWLPGQTLLLRWMEDNDTGDDDGLAIDDFAFYAPITTLTAPQVVTFKPAAGAVQVGLDQRVTVTFDQKVQLTNNWYQLTGNTVGAIACSYAGGPLRYEITPVTQLPLGEMITLTVIANQVSNMAGANMPADVTSSFTTRSNLQNLRTISEVQGTGFTSTWVGSEVTLRGIVTADFQGAAPAFGGFYLQSAQEDSDGNALTSEGIYVADMHADTELEVTPGDQVTVTGTVAEVGGQTQIIQPVLLLKDGSASLPSPSTLRLPVSSLLQLEANEGMLTHFSQTLQVVSNSGDVAFPTDTYAKEGKLHLAPRRLLQPTEFIDPNDVTASGTTVTGSSNVAAITTEQTLQSRSIIVLDDGNAANNPQPTPYLNAQQTRRIGDSVAALTGVLGYVDGRYTLQPTQSVSFADTNSRPLTAPTLSGRLRIASMNVRNYFTTLNSRGATNAAEFIRQRDKIVSAIIGLNADVLGLIEIENNSTALADLLNSINLSLGAEIYSLVTDPAPGVWGDAIRTGILYKQAIAKPVRGCFIDSDAIWHSPSPLRPPHVQLFEEKSTAERFLFCLNHFKSKNATDATGANLDQGDGQGAWNALRKQQSQRLHVFLQQVALSTGENDILVLGDLNAHSEEDPIELLRALGYTDETARFSPLAYSSHYGVNQGKLDHVFSTMSSQITDANYWRINADEPAFYDYNLEGKTASQQAVNVATPFRSSDHDPVLVGLHLSPQSMTYSTWVATQEWSAGSSTGVNADPDWDGLANLLEFLINTDPQQPNSFVLTPSFNQSEIRLDYPQRLGLSGITVQPQWSQDLLTHESLA
jgi:hypothetical protein